MNNWVLATLVALGAAGQSLGQSSTPLSDTELSKESENPVTRVITLPLRYEAEFNDGPTKGVKDTFEIDQAVLPFMLNNDWSLITRTKFPAVSQPPKELGENRAAGLSNGYTTFFLSPEHGAGFYWGVGPVLYYPSATNNALGVNKWGSGPLVAFLKKDAGPWVWGVVVNRLAAYPGQNALARAVREVGCLERTLFILDWISDPALRRRSNAGLNKGEARNALARALFFHRHGEIRDRTFENQRYRASGLNLAIAAITLWNTIYLGHAVAELRLQGEVLPDTLLAHIGPLGWEHISFNGDYVWPSEPVKDGFRPLRNPHSAFLDAA